tara:strand:+ start:647 stop:754 length:108 start_codon:yes stop_codon:yes gene_type:complete
LRESLVRRVTDKLIVKDSWDVTAGYLILMIKDLCA